MSDVIEVRGLRVSAIVGVLPQERESEQLLLVDIDFERPFGDAVVSDDLSKTTNYADVVTLAHGVIVEGRFLLLETLAHRVAQAVLECDPTIVWAHVRAHKVRPPVSEDVTSLGVSCTLHRET